MSELISGKEAFDAAYNGDEAQWRWTGKDVEWRELKGTTAFSIDELKGGVCEFRLKPRTIYLNGIEVPVPFEPEEGEWYWYITDCETGYGEAKNRVGYRVGIAAWRSEEEIKQVVAALRQAFNVKG